MQRTYTIIGSLMSVVSYFWYRHVINYANIFDVMHPDLLSRPQFFPMVLGALGIIILLIGLMKD